MIKVLFMGRKPVAARCLSHILARNDIEVVGVLTDSHLSVSPTTEIAKANDIPLLQLEEAQKAWEGGRLTFDLGLSMLYWRKLGGPLLSAASRGIVNFHPAPLPAFKGVGGYNLAILNGLKEWACTAHYMDEGIDTGDIIRLWPVPMDPDTDTALTLEARAQEALFLLFRETFDRLAAQDTRLSTTPNLGGRYLNRQELEELKRIDPETDNIARKARAFWFPPYDGAFIEIAGERFTLADRSILDGLADPNSSSLFTPARAAAKP